MSGNNTKFTNSSVAKLVDLARYPIADLAGKAGQALVAACRAQLQETGACNLPGFVKTEAAATLAAEALVLGPLAHRDVQTHNVYFKPDDPTLPEDHPARHQLRTAKNSIAYDLIPSDAGIRQLYIWPPIREFVAAILGKERLYLHADPLAALNLFVFNEGDELGWHYDRADFVTTLLLQAPDSGGEFEYVPLIRTPNDENYAGLKRLLSGSDRGVVRLANEPGTLTLFVGHYSIHRVTPVRGQRPRLIAVLSYETEPGVMFSEAARRRFYGRAKPLVNI